MKQAYHAVKVAVSIPVIDNLPRLLHSSKIERLPILVLELILYQLSGQSVGSFYIYCCDSLIGYNLHK